MEASNRDIIRILVPTMLGVIACVLSYYQWVLWHVFNSFFTLAYWATVLACGGLTLRLARVAMGARGGGVAVGGAGTLAIALPSLLLLCSVFLPWTRIYVWATRAERMRIINLAKQDTSGEGILLSDRDRWLSLGRKWNKSDLRARQPENEARVRWANGAARFWLRYDDGWGIDLGSEVFLVYSEDPGFSRQPNQKIRSMGGLWYVVAHNCRLPW